MNRSPSLLTRCAPSPLAPSVMSTPLPARVVGWYWTISMSIRGAPALYARAMPSPVHMRALVLGSKTLPRPPVAMMTALARTTWTSPLLISMSTAPEHSPSSTISDSTNHSS